MVDSSGQRCPTFLAPGTGFMEDNSSTDWRGVGDGLGGFKHTAVFVHFISVVQMVMNPPSAQETQVLSLGQEDALEKGMATHSSILAWRIPWTEEPGGLQSMGSQKSRTRLSH